MIKCWKIFHNLSSITLRIFLFLLLLQLWVCKNTKLLTDFQILNIRGISLQINVQPHAIHYWKMWSSFKIWISLKWLHCTELLRTQAFCFFLVCLEILLMSLSPAKSHQSTQYFGSASRHHCYCLKQHPHVMKTVSPTYKIKIYQGYSVTSLTYNMVGQVGQVMTRLVQIMVDWIGVTYSFARYLS